jgi:small-conductance mechanosensitive channel
MYNEALSLNDLNVFINSFELKKILLLMLSLIILVSVSKLITILAKHLSYQLSTKKTLIFQVSTIITFFLNVFGSIYIFYKVLNPPNELLLAFLGSATFAVGFALKDLVASLIAGIMIILDPPFQVGDRIQYNDIYGEIKHIGLRAVRVNTSDNNIITIPNSSLVNNVVLCTTNGHISMNVLTNFYFSLDCDIIEVQNIIRETIITSKYAYLDKPVEIIVDNHWRQEILCLQLIVKAYVIDARFEKAFQTDLVIRANKILNASNKNTLAKKTATLA